MFDNDDLFSMTEIRGEQGDILFLECLTITGQLESEVHWFKDGSKLSLPTSKMKVINILFFNSTESILSAKKLG